jgi:hypothetical protein
MAIVKNTYIERVLITLNPDGSFKGAHQESLTCIKEGDTVLSQQQGDAVGLTAEALAQALPQQAALMAQLNTVTSERDALLNERNARAV